MTDQRETIELVDVEQEPAAGPVSAGADEARVHAWLRTGAVLAVAVSFTWMATAVADMRDVEKKTLCREELESSIPQFLPGPLRPEWGDELVETAEECGLPLLAEAIRQRYAGE
jgi:hypothetical protein